ncbi:hypothetical protein HH214_06145 [Mucilaginibacter robiniae]|uniref:Uncharacterized protein n=1 Tax=Mucilaginibacter robiniae TaxID=2728022 RepID=A0A7L5E1P4_9SPHI|nr:hypothetical protein [Mucilaginibacter robiniae]QJD95484.1 hypothetical protein HH214_06145 [Mucilaginibacter robiniae]
MAEEKTEAEHLEKTIDAIEHSIENESATGSTTQISTWIKTLSGRRGFAPIVHDLEKLKEAVDHKDGHKIYTLLEKLGEATVEAAEKAEGKEAAAVKKLGKALQKGAKLVKKLVGEPSK